MNRTHKPDYYELLSELKELTNQHELLRIAHSKVCSTCLETLAENEELVEFLGESILENSELIMDLSEAREDRKILAKQLRDERVLSDEFLNTIIRQGKEIRKLQDELYAETEKSSQLEYDLWEASCLELDGMYERAEDPDQYAARHGLI